MNLEQSEWTNDATERNSSSLSKEIQDLMAGFDFGKQQTDRKLPAGFAAADDLLGDEETAGPPEEIIEFAKEDARSGGLSISADYARQLLKDLGNGALKEAAAQLTHERAKEIWEEMRQSDSDGSSKTAEINDGRLTESELRGAYSSSSIEQKAAILYALSDFKKTAAAGNYFTADWTMTAIDKDDIYYAKER